MSYDLFCSNNQYILIELVKRLEVSYVYIEHIYRKEKKSENEKLVRLYRVQKKCLPLFYEKYAVRIQPIISLKHATKS